MNEKEKFAETLQKLHQAKKIQVYFFFCRTVDNYSKKIKNAGISLIQKQ